MQLMLAQKCAECRPDAFSNASPYSYAITNPVFEQAQNLLYTQDWPPHHALADARALMAGYRAWRPGMEKIWKIQ